MQKVRWTPEEDSIVKKLHQLKASMRIFKEELPGRTDIAIYRRVAILKLKREPRVLPINTADFSNKVNKRQLEKETAAIVAAGQKGGFFGIPGPAIKEHHEAFSPILRANSPFLAVEENTMQYNKMREAIKRINGIELIQGDLFDILKGYVKHRDASKIALFSYGHLDFCKTAHVLMRDYKLHDNLMWLAKWSQLKTTFYLDISVSCRCDEDKMYERFFQMYVPDIFTMCGWKVEDPRNCGTKFYKTYRDATPMANALYKMTKK